jgi:hypothetical protein
VSILKAHESSKRTWSVQTRHPMAWQEWPVQRNRQRNYSTLPEPLNYTPSFSHDSLILSATLTDDHSQPPERVGQIIVTFGRPYSRIGVGTTQEDIARIHNGYPRSSSTHTHTHTHQPSIHSAIKVHYPCPHQQDYRDFYCASDPF